MPHFFCCGRAQYFKKTINKKTKSTFNTGRCCDCKKHFVDVGEVFLEGRKAKEYLKKRRSDLVRVKSQLPTYQGKVIYDYTKYYKSKRIKSRNGVYDYQTEHYLMTDYPTGRETSKQAV